jgi:hypothetical protein
MVRVFPELVFPEPGWAEHGRLDVSFSDELGT